MIVTILVVLAVSSWEKECPWSQILWLAVPTNVMDSASERRILERPRSRGRQRQLEHEAFFGTRIDYTELVEMGQDFAKKMK